MPDAQGQNAFDPQRFAALVASFENNPNEAEAMNAARMLRRAAKGHHPPLRVVDLFYRADVMAALDAALQPVRETPDRAVLDAAQTECAELRAKLAAVLPKVTELTDELIREKELTAELTARLRGQNPAGAAKQGQGNPLSEPTAGGWLAALAALAAAGMMIASAFR
jgi:hypothetical protein